MFNENNENRLYQLIEEDYIEVHIEHRDGLSIYSLGVIYIHSYTMGL